LYEEYGSRMILGRGLGMHTIPIRIFNPGELVVVELDCDA
jgi:Predicted phosphohydrolases